MGSFPPKGACTGTGLLQALVQSESLPPPHPKAPGAARTQAASLTVGASVPTEGIPHGFNQGPEAQPHRQPCKERSGQDLQPARGAAGTHIAAKAAQRRKRTEPRTGLRRKARCPSQAAPDGLPQPPPGIAADDPGARGTVGASGGSAAGPAAPESSRLRRPPSPEGKQQPREKPPRPAPFPGSPPTAASRPTRVTGTFRSRARSFSCGQSKSGAASTGAPPADATPRPAPPRPGRGSPGTWPWALPRSSAAGPPGLCEPPPRSARAATPTGAAPPRRGRAARPRPAPRVLPAGEGEERRRGPTPTPPCSPGASPRAPATTSPRVWLPVGSSRFRCATSGRAQARLSRRAPDGRLPRGPSARFPRAESGETPAGTAEAARAGQGEGRAPGGSRARRRREAGWRPPGRLALGRMHRCWSPPTPLPPSRDFLWVGAPEAAGRVVPERWIRPRACSTGWRGGGGGSPCRESLLSLGKARRSLRCCSAWVGWVQSAGNPVAAETEPSRRSEPALWNSIGWESASGL